MLLPHVLERKLLLVGGEEICPRVMDLIRALVRVLPETACKEGVGRGGGGAYLDGGGLLIRVAFNCEVAQTFKAKMGMLTWNIA